MPEATPVKTKEAPQHRHPIEWIGRTYEMTKKGMQLVDPGQRRDIRYHFNCPACKQADAARCGVDKPGVPASELRTTIFLIPDSDFDSRVAKAYLEAKYGTAAEQQGCSLLCMDSVPLRTVVGKKAQIVVCVRRGQGRPPKTPTIRAQDDKGQWIDTGAETPLPECFPEIVESPPLKVDDLVFRSEGDFFTDSEQSFDALIAELADHAYPMRVLPPRVEKDKLILRGV